MKSTNIFVDISLIGGIMLGIEFLEDPEENCFYIIIDLLIVRVIITKEN